MGVHRSIGVAQTVPVRGDVQANIEQHLALAELAAAERADVLIYPELSLTGYELDLARQLAFTADDPRLAPLRSAARRHLITLIVGAPAQIDGALHLGAFALAPTGEVLVHTKGRLGAFAPEDCGDQPVPPAEASVFVSGTRRPLIKVRSWYAALGICAESLRRSHPAGAAERGASSYLTSHFALPSDSEQRHAFLRAQAAEHQLAIAFASYGGPTAGLVAGGRSAIWSPRGTLVAELPEQGAGLAVAIETESGWQRVTRLDFGGPDPR